MAARRRSSGSRRRRYSASRRLFSSVEEVAAIASAVRAKSSTVLYRSGAPLPLPGTAIQGTTWTSPCLPLRLPRGQEVQGESGLARVSADLRPRLRGLSPLPGGEGPGGRDHPPLHRLSAL